MTLVPPTVAASEARYTRWWWQCARNQGVAWHLLDVPGIGAFGPAKLKTGRIGIWP
jgi:hypothetical protein